MTKHHSTDCSATVRSPPIGIWNSSQAVAFPNDHKYAAAWPKCCGATANMMIYHKRCFRFCDVDANQTDVVSCLKDAGVKKAVGFNSTDTEDESSAVVLSRPISKSAIGLAFVLLAGLAVGGL